jgi:hypothetical protein
MRQTMGGDSYGYKGIERKPEGDAEGGQPFLGFLYHGVVAAAPHDQGNFCCVRHNAQGSIKEKKGYRRDSLHQFGIAGLDPLTKIDLSDIFSLLFANQRL